MSWRLKAKREAIVGGHHLGNYINWPPMKPGQSDRGIRSLAMCRSCEATLLVIHDPVPGEQKISGTATTHRCPYVYSLADVAAIDRAHPVSTGPARSLQAHAPTPPAIGSSAPTKSLTERKKARHGTTPR